MHVALSSCFNQYSRKSNMDQFFKKVFIFSHCILLSFFLLAQSKDTSLFTIYSVPYYFNVVKTPEGKIIAGTSNGMYLMNGIHPQKLNNESGYVTVNKKQQPVIDSNGIKYHDDKSMMHLLPFPTERRDAYYAGSGEYFFITSGGKMHVYQLLPFQILYRNHSVRTISPHFVGTYSGIYYQGNIHPRLATFCDGYIREYHNKYFICSSDLMVMESYYKGDSIQTRFLSMPKHAIFREHIRDVGYTNTSNEFIVNSTRSLAVMDTSLRQATAIFRSLDENAELVLLGEDSNRRMVLFAHGRNLMSYFTFSKAIHKLDQLPDQILDGYITRLNYYMLIKNGLYVRYADKRLEKLVSLEKAHTLRSISPSELAIGTDNGLFLYNTITRNLKCIIPGVEFNRKGLFVHEQKLYAGSVSGLYVLDIPQLEQISVHMNASGTATYVLPGWLLPLAIVLMLTVAILLYMVLRYRKKMRTLGSEIVLPTAPENVEVTRENILSFINENLTSASLHSITDHFRISSTQVYIILEPDRPGAIIQELRLQKVKQLRKDGKTAKAIAEVTGLSASYIRKIWNNFSDDEQA
jgi:hypothetical protein